MKLNKQIFGWLGASALLLTASSCVSDSLSPEPQLDDANEVVYGNGSKIVTINVTPDSYVGTRAISDGSAATSLYFEVYDLGENGNDQTQIVGSSNGQNETPVIVTLISNNDALSVNNYKATIKLAVDETHKYRISLWAAKSDQVGSDKLFTITGSPLHVAVDYSKINNNDDAMDAFCASEFFEGDAKNVDVVLHRPFAQLNVGTTGADYNNYITGNIIPHKTITYSKVVVKGISNSIDVANDKISDASDDEVEFAFAQTIAEQTKATEEYLKVKLNDPKLTKVSWGTIPKDRSVSIGEDNFFGFKNSYPTIKQKGEGVTVEENVDQSVYYLTEKFKYLSMCYVLVSSGISDNLEGITQGGTWNGNDPLTGDTYKSSTLTSVDVYFAETNDDSSTSNSTAYKNEQKYFTVKNVPVHRNWRTNLLGGLADASYPDPNDPTPDPDDPKNPDPDPDGPDDPSSLFYNVKIAVYLCPIYWGEFNGQYNPEEENNYASINAGWFPKEPGNDLHDDVYHKGKTPSSSAE